MDKPNIQLPALQDPTQYVLDEGIPILDETADPKFTKEFLKETVKRTNKRCEEGDLTLVTIGHTEDDKPETEQPPLVGYAKNMRVSQFNGKVTILADLYIKRDRYNEAMNYPRRSAEVWHGDESGFIDIVSLLLRTPQCDLGLLTFEKKGDKSIYLSPEDGDEMTEEQIDKLASRFAASLEDVLARFAKSKNEKDDDEEKDEEKKCDKSEGEEKDEECHSHNDKDDDEDKDEEKSENDKEDGDDEEKSENAASVASGDNAFVPGEVEDKEKKKLAKDSALIRLARAETALAEMTAQRDVLQLKLRRSERTYDLKQLEAEGFTFDVAEELALVETLSDQDYAKHMDRARKLYRRSVAGAPMVRIGETQEPGFSKDDMEKVLKFKKDNNISDYHVALTRYKQEVK